MAAKRKTQRSGQVVRSKASRKAGEERVILFPTEPSVIGLDKIIAAVEAVRAERKMKK